MNREHTYDIPATKQKEQSKADSIRVLDMEPGYFQLEFPVRQVASVLEIYFSVFSFQYGCELPYWKFELEIYRTWIFAGRASVLDLLAFCKICIFVAHACHAIWHFPDFFFQNGCGDTTGNFSGNIHFQNAFSHAHPCWKYTFAPNWKYPDTVYFFQYKCGWEAKPSKFWKNGVPYCML